MNRQSPIASIAGQGIGLPWVLATTFVFGIAWTTGREQLRLRSRSPMSSIRMVWLSLLYFILMVVINVGLGLTGKQVMLFAFVNTLLVGLSEQLMFRSNLFAGLPTRFKIWTAILLTSSAFGIVHALSVFTPCDLMKRSSNR